MTLALEPNVAGGGRHDIPSRRCPNSQTPKLQNTIWPPPTVPSTSASGKAVAEDLARLAHPVRTHSPSCCPSSQARNTELGSDNHESSNTQPRSNLLSPSHVDPSQVDVVFPTPWCRTAWVCLLTLACRRWCLEAQLCDDHAAKCRCSAPGRLLRNIITHL